MSAEVPVSDLGCCARQTGSDREAWIIREATKKDVRVICRLVRDLARHVGSEREVVLSQEALEPALFGEDPSVKVLVAEMDGRVVGFASWFRTFSTWTGRGASILRISSSFLKHVAAVLEVDSFGSLRVWQAIAATDAWNGRSYVRTSKPRASTGI